MVKDPITDQIRKLSTQLKETIKLADEAIRGADGSSYLENVNVVGFFNPFTTRTCKSLERSQVEKFSDNMTREIADQIQRAIRGEPNRAGVLDS